MEIISKLPGIIARGGETGEWQELSLWIQEEASYIFTNGDLAAYRPLPFTEMEPLFNFWRKPPPVSEELLFEIAVFCEGEWRRFDSEAQTWLMDHIFDLFSSENINPEDYLVVLVDTVSIYFDERRAANVFLALLKSKDENQRSIAAYGLSSLAIKANSKEFIEELRQHLIRLIEDKSDMVRAEACVGLSYVELEDRCIFSSRTKTRYRNF